MNKDSVQKFLMRFENIKISRFFSVTLLMPSTKKKKQNKIIRVVGSVCKPTGILNRSTGSEAMQAWHQDNFVGVLNRPAGSEAMSGKRKTKKLHEASCKVLILI
jgi:hypothetical protein